MRPTQWNELWLSTKIEILKYINDLGAAQYVSLKEVANSKFSTEVVYNIGDAQPFCLKEIAKSKLPTNESNTKRHSVLLPTEIIICTDILHPRDEQVNYRYTIKRKNVLLVCYLLISRVLEQSCGRCKTMLPFLNFVSFTASLFTCSSYTYNCHVSG